MEKKDLITLLQTHAKEFVPVVPLNRAKDRVVSIDLSAKNSELSAEITADTNRFMGYINQYLHQHNARYGIGGYLELRELYGRSGLFQGEEEPRRLHLGIDIWGRPHTPVIAPLEGVVHSFAHNAGFGNYGTTVILTHRLEGKHFYTLYGHLSRSSIVNMSEGQKVEKGEIFAEFGIPFDNGDWPPHLHFQLICDLQGMRGDYPGVCALSQRSFYEENCPDPALLAGISPVS